MIIFLYKILNHVGILKIPIPSQASIDKPSIFANSILTHSNNLSIQVHQKLLLWPVLVLFLIFLIIVLNKLSNKLSYFKIIKSMFNFNTSSQVFRFKNTQMSKVNFGFIVCFILVFAFYLIQINTHFHYIFNSFSLFTQYVLFIGILIATIFIKFLINKFFQFITNSNKLFLNYWFIYLNFYNLLGLIFFTITLYLQFCHINTTWFYNLSFVAIIILYLIRMIRIFYISAIEENISMFYIILYFCAIDILPTLVFIKLLFIYF